MFLLSYREKEDIPIVVHYYIENSVASHSSTAPPPPILKYKYQHRVLIMSTYRTVPMKK